MSILSAVLLGIVQGIAEFLPISSSGHLSVLQNFFNMSTAEEGHLFFDVLLHLGTLVSVCLVYRRDIIVIIADVFACIHDSTHPTPGGPREYPGARLLMMMFFATLPLFVILPVKSLIDGLYYNTWFIGIAFLFTGFMLHFSDRLPNGRKNERNMWLSDALFVGVCQAIATVPGLSRSGSTISGGIFRGMDREFAAKFSFLISIPAILGANLLSLFDALDEGFDTELLPAYLIGTLVAMVVGYFSVSLVRIICRRGHFGSFAYYCWLAGVVTIMLSIFM